MPTPKGIIPFLILLLIASAVFAVIWIYQVDPVLCNGCGGCIYWCNTGALYMEGGKAVIDPELCNGCGICADHCPRDAIYKVYYEGIEEAESSVSPTYGPNPTHGPFCIEGAQPGTDIYVLDMSGRLVAKTGTDSNGYALLDISGSASGHYCVMLGENILGEITLVQN
ncbi:MAG: 4Fe-4S binding protein [Candidatus Aegiribacteria sp.]|nr:4Fe-4S binding protein [Candidatus Aegiribacteria sp.]